MPEDKSLGEIFRFDNSAANTGLSLRQYRPLLASWLLELTLMLDWHIPHRGASVSEIFEDERFIDATGLQLPVESSASSDSRTCRTLIATHLDRLRRESMDPELPLFANISQLVHLLELSAAEQLVLTFTAALEFFESFRTCIASRIRHASDSQLCRVLSRLGRIPERNVVKALGAGGILRETGLVTHYSGTDVPFDSKLGLHFSLQSILMLPHLTTDELIGHFVKRAKQASLSLDAFPHLARDSKALKAYLGNSLAQAVPGVNVMLYGPPGVGKTEFARALANEMNAELYEISDACDHSLKGAPRLRAYRLCQLLLARKRNALFLFDEIEDDICCDTFMTVPTLGGEGDETGSKSWINGILENNPVPAIWISNHVEQIDPSHRRRFDYAVRFSVPPQAVRVKIAAHHCGRFNPPADWIERVAAHESLSPGQLEKAAKVAGTGGGDDNGKTLELLELALERSSSFLGQSRMPAGSRQERFNIAYLNTDTDMSLLIEGLKRRPYGTFCFYGSSGTGKSASARYLADEIGKQTIVCRASDILSKWVGDSEKYIASLFDQARNQDAVLLLDEADSFLRNRREATHRWEVTMVNEMLYQMEAFAGVFICTTNLMEMIDQACLRRFTFRVRFDLLTPRQRWEMFLDQLDLLGGDSTEASTWQEPVCRLERLTPGDFSTAARQFEIIGQPVTPTALYEILRRECMAKGGTPERIGY